jgi:hypothetical protein
MGDRGVAGGALRTGDVAAEDSDQAPGPEAAENGRGR